MFLILTTIGVGLFSFAWAWQNTNWIMNWFASKGLGEAVEKKSSNTIVNTSNTA